MRRGEDETAPRAVRVLDAGPDPAGARRSQRRPVAWLPLLLGVILATGVLAVSTPHGGSSVPEEPAGTGFSGYLDLTSSAVPGYMTAMLPGQITGDTVVLDVASIGGRIAAVGIGNNRAAAWVTTSGNRWQPASVQEPASSRSVITNIVDWQGETYGYGRLDSAAALWHAATADRWEYGGAIPAFGSASLIDIGVARTLLAATEGEDGSVALYTSSDALHWSGVAPVGLGSANQIQAMVGRGGWFYAVGMDCSGQACTPSIRRSATGESWESLTVPIVGRGRLVAVAATRDALITAGTLDTGDGSPEALVLVSHDGVTWARVGGDQEPFQPERGSVELSSIRGGTAALVINGRPYDLADGASVRADAMRFTLAEVATDHVTLQLAGSEQLVALGDAVTFDAAVSPSHIAALGERIVLSGAYVSDGGEPQATVAGVWSSMDGGGQWARSAPEEGAFGTAVTPYTLGTRIMLVGLASGETRTWVSQWKAGAAEELDYAADGGSPP